MAEALTTITKLLIVRDIQEDANGAALCFQGGEYGYIGSQENYYANYLRLARRGRERQHPIAVSWGEGQVIKELLRADNDVPAQFAEDDPDGVAVFFQGHDGVFRLTSDRAEYARLRGLLSEAMGRKASVWFIARKPDLVLLDVLPAGGTTARDGNSHG
jgi:hypothetical protein